MRFCIILVFLLVLMPNNIVGEEILLDSDNYVKVYYFRSNFRCANCYKIEEYTKEVIEEFLKEESNAERLVYEVANIDEEKNYHFVEDYQLYTKSVVISIIKNGEEVKYKNEADFDVFISICIHHKHFLYTTKNRRFVLYRWETNFC